MNDMGMTDKQFNGFIRFLTCSATSEADWPEKTSCGARTRDS